jgi:hypothetical protein
VRRPAAPRRPAPALALLLVVAIGALLGLVLTLRRSEPDPPPPAAEERALATPQPRAPLPPAGAVLSQPEPEAAEAPAPPSRRDAVRSLLEKSLAEHFPDRKLSSDELDAATDALMRLRAARLELNALPRTPENAERLRELTAAMGEASADFEYVVEIDPITFTERASGGFDDDPEEETE